MFIDGIKLEANENRYSFVWRKSAEKNEAKTQEKMETELPKLAAKFGVRFYVGVKIRAKDLKQLRKRFYGLKIGIEFASSAKAGESIPGKDN